MNVQTIDKTSPSRFKFTIQKLNPILSFSVPSGTPLSGFPLPTINMPYSFFNVSTSSILTGAKPHSQAGGEDAENAETNEGNSISLPISIGKLLNS